MTSTGDASKGTGDGWLGVGTAAVVVACCAAGPFLLAAVGGLTVGALLGIGAGLAAIVIAVLVIALGRKRT